MLHVTFADSLEDARTVLAHARHAARIGGRGRTPLQERVGFKSVGSRCGAPRGHRERDEWGAMLFAEGSGTYSRRHEITIVDRLGAGDSFTGAYLRAAALRRAGARGSISPGRSTLKHTIPRRLLPLLYACNARRRAGRPGVCSGDVNSLELSHLVEAVGAASFRVRPQTATASEPSQKALHRAGALIPRPNLS